MATFDEQRVETALDTLFAPAAAHGLSLAAVVLLDGQVVAERYGTQPDTVFGPGGPVTAESTLVSWSMAKSIVHAAVGILVGEGRLDVGAPAPVEAWRGTEKEAITLQDLLDMRPGLEFVEDYVDDAVSHCLEMLWGSGAADMAAYAASLPLIHRPGTVWNYSSGTTNIISRIVGNEVGGGRDAMDAFLHDRLFAPAGMHSAIAKFDDAGTFIGSSFVYATARDFAKFGELYRNDGMVGDVRVLPAAWRDHARTYVASDPDGDFDYGRQWWLWRDQPGSLACHGYEGQYTVVVPLRRIVVVHLGKSPIEQRDALNAQLREIVDAFPEA